MSAGKRGCASQSIRILESPELQKVSQSSCKRPTNDTKQFRESG